MSNSPDRLTAALNQVKKDVRMLINPKTYENMSQNQVIGTLTVMLLVVGIAAGVYLGGQQQELRQQASVAYPQCSNTTGACDGVAAGGRCIGLAGTCQNSETNAFCSCVPDQPTATPNTCTPQGFCTAGGNGPCCDGQTPQFRPDICTSNSRTWCPSPQCVIDGQACTPGGAICCGGTSACIGGTCQARYCDRNGPGTNQCGDVPLGTHCGFNNQGTCTPTTVDQANAECICVGGGNPTGVPPTNTPTGVPPTGVPPTGVPPTGVPPTGVPPTAVPPTNTPGGPTATATNTPGIAPICVNVVMNNPASTTPNTPPNVGDAVTLTCSQVAGATRYEFRFRLPNMTFVSLNPSTATINVSQQYQIPSAGSFTAYCRPCAGTDASTCAPWEN